MRITYPEKIQFSIILFFALSLLVGCAPSFPKVKSFYISPFELTADEKEYYTALALSPGGEMMAVASVNGSYAVANLATGEREALTSNLENWQNTILANHDLVGYLVDWSFDQRYLGFSADHYELNSNRPAGMALYVFDMQEDTFTRYDVGAGIFSPFNSDQVMIGIDVYNLRDGTMISSPVDFDFAQEQEFGATVQGKLWSKKLGVPVAELQTSSKDVSTEITIDSFNLIQPKYSIPIGFTSKHPNELVKSLFDPTGKYVLTVEWQCSESPTSCATSPVFYSDNVYDTVLTLIHWRTKKQQELIQLSEIDPENVLADGYMAWSADGSTIFISRKDAPAVVLKLK